MTKSSLAFEMLSVFSLTDVFHVLPREVCKRRSFDVQYASPIVIRLTLSGSRY